MLLGIWWLWWAVGTFGIVGTALLAWLAPTILVKSATTLLTFFISNRYGNMIAVGLIVFFVADINRSLRDEEEFAQRTAAFEQQQKQRDIRIALDTRAQTIKDMQQQASSDAKTDQEVKEFKDALPPVPYATSNPFRVGADACKLRALAGQSGCGPASSARRVQKAGAPPKNSGDHRRIGLPGFIKRSFGRE